MRTAVSITLLLTWLMVGCSHSGHVDAFVVTEVSKYGGHTKTNTTIPKLDGRWKIQRDKNGFQATVTGVSFSAIDAQMRQVFGTPSRSGMSTGTKPDLPYSNWAARDIGVAIMMIGYTNRVQITCLRGVTNVREFFRGGKQ